MEISEFAALFIQFEKNEKGNRGDMRKIYVTRQFFEANGSLGQFFDEGKNLFLDMPEPNVCIKYHHYRFSFGQGIAI